MKKIFSKLYGALMGLVPVCAIFMLSSQINSTACWFQGQDTMPDGTKKYRKF